MCHRSWCGVQYNVSVSMVFDGIGTGIALVENVTFVAPPMLESIDLVETSGSASLTFINVAVGASVAHPDAGPLMYSYSSTE